MADFGAVIAAQLAGNEVRKAALVKFDFLSSTVRLWQGFGPLVTQDGFTWNGTGKLVGSIEGIEQPINGEAPAQTLTLSGVDEDFVAKVKDERDEYYRRYVTVYLQFFDSDWQTLDSPFTITVREMQQITATCQIGDDGARVHSISVTAETPFTTRRRPPFSYMTDRDQQRRFPGDKGCEFTANIDGKNITFPDY